MPRRRAMKSAIFAAALLIGGGALAQDYPDPATTDTVPAPAETTTTTISPDAGLIAPAAVTAATGQIVMPGNTNPERDARGIPVISDPAKAPAGFNQIPDVPGLGGPFIAAQGPAPTEPATESYPPCTREVTDNCVQTYERGRSPDQA